MNKMSINQELNSEQMSLVLENQTNVNYKTEIESLFFLFLKRIVDIFSAIFGLILTVPIFLILCIFYSIGKNKGPILFGQTRFGKNGKKFKIYKFRSMIVDAEKVLRENDFLYKKYIKNNYKLLPDEDPRTTKFGRFIRKTSIDELPQLWNVLIGDMSLIGPRPIVEDELKEYKGIESDFLSVKPGITGYWQVCGRSEIGYPERVSIELFYVKNKSIKLDTVIFFKTIIYVLLRKGAH